MVWVLQLIQLFQVDSQQVEDKETMRHVSVINRNFLGRVVAIDLGMLGLIVLVLFSDSND